MIVLFPNCLIYIGVISGKVMKDVLSGLCVSLIVLSMTPLCRCGVNLGVPEEYWSPDYSDVYVSDSLIPVVEPALKLFISSDGDDKAEGSRSKPYRLQVLYPRSR